MSRNYGNKEVCKVGMYIYIYVAMSVYMLYTYMSWILCCILVVVMVKIILGMKVEWILVEVGM